MVEGNRTLCKALEAIFAATPSLRCVGAFSSAEDALRLLPASGPQVVVVGLGLPGMGGLECICRLRQKLPQLRVIALSHFHQPEQLFDALKAGVLACVLKPAIPAKLIEAIETVHQGGGWASPPLACLIFQHFQQLPDAKTPTTGNLSRREREIILLAKHGLTNELIAKRLRVEYNTVRTHLRNIYEKLGVRSRGEAVARHFQL